jgi:hypothetical protein
VSASRFAAAGLLAAIVAACGQTDGASTSADAAAVDAEAGGSDAAGAADVTDASTSDSVSANDAQVGDALGADAASIAAPRLTSPLDTATVSAQLPRITWVLPAGVDGAHVEVCKDRGCATIETSFDAAGNSGAPAVALSPGVHFFRAAGRVGTSVGSAKSATWEMLVGHRSAPRDASWGAFPDFDGDGRADVMAAGGSAFVDIFRGERLGPTSAAVVHVSDPSHQPDDNFPRATFGDIDGDGFSDLIVGNITATASKDGSNRISVYRGSAAGFTALSAPSWIIHVPPPDVDGGAAFTYFAASVTVPGDVNGDGYADILASSITSGDVKGPTFVFFGHASGPSSVPDTELHGEGVAYHMFPAGPIGDVDGDGYADVLCGTEAGWGTFLFMGGPSGPLDTRRRTVVHPATAGGDFGRLLVGTGDLDGDGLPDFAIGAPSSGADGGSSPGQVYVFRGETGPGIVAADWTLTGPDGNGGNFGAAGTTAGDLDGDGYDDMVIGAQQAFGSAGRAYYFRGGPSGVSDGARVTLMGPGGGGWFGGAAQAGDIDGDGFADTLVAASVYGEIFVFYGQAGGISDRTTQTTLTSPGYLYILAEKSRALAHLLGIAT